MSHLVQKTSKCLRLQNPLQPKFRARIWRLRVSPTTGSAGKGVFLRYTDERDAFWLKCESQHAMCEKTRRNSPRVCGWADFIVNLSCAPWVIFNSLEPFPHQHTTKKVSSPHVKCNVFCSKALKKVVSYLTSVLNTRFRVVSHMAMYRKNDACNCKTFLRLCRITVGIVHNYS